MSYNKPGLPVIIQNAQGERMLFIPKYQQRQEGDRHVFSYTSPGPTSNGLSMDNPRDLSKNYLAGLKDLARIIGVSASKMKKQELIELLSRRVVFE